MPASQGTEKWESALENFPLCTLAQEATERCDSVTQESKSEKKKTQDPRNRDSKTKKGWRGVPG